MTLTMADHIDPAPGAVELSIHGLGVGGQVAVRAHKDLRGELPDEFQIKINSIEDDELKQANVSKEKGNKCYKSADYAKAIKYYERGITYINEFSTENEVTDESKDIWLKLTKNLGRCHFKQGNHEQSLQKFDEILLIDQNNLDVLMLKCEVLTSENRLDPLMSTCQQIILLKPGDAIETKMKQRIEKIKAVKKRQDEKYKKMCQKMTGTFEPKTTQKTQQAPIPAAKADESNLRN